METVAICTPQFEHLLPKNKYYELELFNNKISFGLIETPTSEGLLYDSIENTVLIEKKAFSCNFRDRSLLLKFNEKCRDTISKHYFMPFGSEFVGKVINVGKNVKKLKIGDRVIPDATYPFKNNLDYGGIPTNAASQRFQKFHVNEVVKIPDNISDEVAASMTISGQTVFSMVRKLGLNKNSKVLVTAASSSTSLLAIQALVNCDYDVYALTTNRHFLDLSKNWKIKRIYTQDDRTNLNSLAASIGGFDAILDPFCDIYFPKVFHLLGYDGKYITCGLYNQHSAFNFKDDSKTSINDVLLKCMAKNIEIIGNCLGSLSDIETAIKEISLGKCKIIIDSVYSANNVDSFIKRSFNSPERLGKVVYKY